MTAKEALKVIDKVHDYPYPYGIGGTAWLYIRGCIEKRIPKKVTDIHVDEYYCPACGAENNKDYSSNSGDDYCPDCGQALDWSDSE